ncbi:MAG: YndJ family transporter [Acidimicrobiales bacterium]
MSATSVRDIKQMFVSEVYLERLLTSRVPAVETVFGAMVWVGIVVGFVRDVDTALWMLAALVGVPLALRLAQRETAGPTTASIAWLRVFSVPVAMVASLSLLAPGPLAFVLSLPWLAVASLIALAGIFRFLSRPSITNPMVAMDAGLVLVGVTAVNFTLGYIGIGSSAHIGLQSIVFLLPVVAAECVHRRHGRWWVPQAMTIAVLGGAFAVLYGDVARLPGITIVALVCLGTAVLAIRVANEQPANVQIGLMTGGVSIGLGAGLLLAAEGFAFFDITGDALDLIRTFDRPLLAFGLVPVVFGLVLIPVQRQPGQRRTFFHLGPPTREQLSRLAQELQHQVPKAEVNPFSDHAPEGYRLHRSTRPVPDFENSCEALWTWAGHEAAGIELTPEQPPILIGKEFVFSVPIGPLTITSTGRVVALISDEDHYGFVYSTLDHHPFVGTEAILLDKSTGRSELTISTVWRPNCLATRLLGPLTNKALDHVVGRYLNGIAEAEAATIGARMMDLMSDMNQRRYAVSRDAIRAEATRSLPSATEVLEEEVETQPLSEFEALFAQPLHGHAQDEVDQPVESAVPPAEPEFGVADLQQLYSIAEPIGDSSDDRPEG